jgi:hypothetical protein
VKVVSDSFRRNASKKASMTTEPFSTIGNHRAAVRVLTLNLWQLYGSWPERRALLINGLRTVQPDVAAFQESIKKDEYDQISDLLGSTFHIVHSKNRDQQGMGISMASRWSLGEIRELDLNVTPRCAGFPAGTLVVEV